MNNKRPSEPVPVQDAIQEAKEKLVAPLLNEVSRLQREFDLAEAGLKAVSGLSSRSAEVKARVKEAEEIVECRCADLESAKDALERL